MAIGFRGFNLGSIGLTAPRYLDLVLISARPALLQVLAGALTDLHDQGVKGTLFNRIQASIFQY